jgi:hypothetical protein
MSMHSPIEPPLRSKSATGAPRNTKRTRVLMIGTLVTPAGSQQVRLRDISRTGAQLIVEKDPPIGRDAVLHRGPLFAASRVAWIRDGEVGLEFYRELSADELDGILPASRKPVAR